MKAEILANIKTLAEQEKVLGSLNEFNDLVTAFYKIQDEEERQWEIKKLERIEAGEKPEAIEKPVYPLLDEFKAFTQLFHEKKKVEIQEQRDSEKANLDKKKALVAALTDLVQNEENIGRAIGRFKDINESWKEVGPIPRDKRQGIQKEFSNLVDTFHYNINIYKEIKDHDLTRNFKLKQDVIAGLKALVSMDKIKEVEKELHRLQDEWNGIGGTHQEDWEKIKDEYWTTVNQVYEKIHAFYDERRAKQAENIEKKRVLINKAAAITENPCSTHQEYKTTTDQLLALQEEWKTIGFGPKEENDKVWEEFRAVFNVFFDAKKAFYNQQDEKFAGVRKAKEALIEKVVGFKDSTDWGDTTKQIIAIQKEWKKLGSAGNKHENKLWKKFRDPIDAFFTAKDSHFEEKDQAGKENLDKKDAIIAEIKAYKSAKDPKKAIEDLRSFSKAFAEIGNVPFKEKDSVYKAYKTALDAQYDAIKMDKDEKQKMLFQSKLDTLVGNDQLMEKEQQFIRRRIDQLNQDILKYENNLGFFANADESNPLFKNVMKDINQTKSQIDDCKAQLKMIREAKKAAAAEASVNAESENTPELDTAAEENE